MNSTDGLKGFEVKSSFEITPEKDHLAYMFQGGSGGTYIREPSQEDKDYIKSRDTTCIIFLLVSVIVVLELFF